MWSIIYYFIWIKLNKITFVNYLFDLRWSWNWNNLLYHSIFFFNFKWKSFKFLHFNFLFWFIKRKKSCKNLKKKIEKRNICSEFFIFSTSLRNLVTIEKYSRSGKWLKGHHRIKTMERSMVQFDHYTDFEFQSLSRLRLFSASQLKVNRISKHIHHSFIRMVVHWFYKQVESYELSCDILLRSLANCDQIGSRYVGYKVNRCSKIRNFIEWREIKSNGLNLE